jgi:hypothetical protein
LAWAVKVALVLLAVLLLVSQGLPYLLWLLMLLAVELVLAVLVLMLPKLVLLKILLQVLVLAEQPLLHKYYKTKWLHKI